MLSIITVFLCGIAALLANALQTTPSQLLANTSFNELFTIQRTLNITATTTTARRTGCFYHSDPPVFYPTTKSDCEAVLDAWVSGRDLYEPRLFSRKSSYLVKDIKVPLVRQYGTCNLELDMLAEGATDTMSLADVYAGIIGPDGPVKRCVGLQSSDRLGGGMFVGLKGKLLATISGMRVRMDGELSRREPY